MEDALSEAVITLTAGNSINENVILNTVNSSSRNLQDYQELYKLKQNNPPSS